MTSETSSPLLFLESPSPRVAPALPEAHGHPTTEATSVVLSSSLVSASRAATRDPRPASTRLHHQS